MGQYWKIVNIDKREEIPNIGGKLQQLLIGPTDTGWSGHALVQLLTVPVVTALDVLFSVEQASQ